MLGNSMYYGKGAGKLPTASAVVGDVVDCARNQGRTLPCLWDAKEAVLADVGEVERRFFVRVKPEALEEVMAAFPGGEKVDAGRSKDTGYVTASLKEKEFAAKAKLLGDALLGKIRIGD